MDYTLYCIYTLIILLGVFFGFFMVLLIAKVLLIEKPAPFIKAESRIRKYKIKKFDFDKEEEYSKGDLSVLKERTTPRDSWVDLNCQFDGEEESDVIQRKQQTEDESYEILKNRDYTKK